MYWKPQNCVKLNLKYVGVYSTLWPLLVQNESNIVYSLSSMRVNQSTFRDFVLIWWGWAWESHYQNEHSLYTAMYVRIIFKSADFLKNFARKETLSDDKENFNVTTVTSCTWGRKCIWDNELHFCSWNRKVLVHFRARFSMNLLVGRTKDGPPERR